jgi:hypothetical protein
MPDQPADPIHYDTKTPPEKKQDNRMPGKRASGEVSAESGLNKNEDPGREVPPATPTTHYSLISVL